MSENKSASLFAYWPGQPDSIPNYKYIPQTRGTEDAKKETNLASGQRSFPSI